MSKYRFFVSDFVEIQRNSFRDFLEKGFIEEFCKHNPIINNKKNIEIFFYPEHYQLTTPELNPRTAIIKGKSYSSKIFIPVQLTDKKNKKIFFQWAFLGNLPLMTKRGHFILNGAARVIVNQILRSPGIYYHEKMYFNDSLESGKGQGNQDETESKNTFFKRYYADIICVKGTWLRIEIDKDQMIWAQMKKTPKIPIFWFLMSMGLTEKIILNSILDSKRLLQNLEPISDTIKTKYTYVQTPPEAWREIYFLLSGNKELQLNAEEILGTTNPTKIGLSKSLDKNFSTNLTSSKNTSTTPFLQKKNKETETLEPKNKQLAGNRSKKLEKKEKIHLKNFYKKNALAIANGRKWIFNRFLNPRTYDLGLFGRNALNKKLSLSISKNQTTLTPQDILKATDLLIKVEKGLKKIDDIDNLKNKRVRTSGELLQIQLSTSLLRLEKVIRDKINNINFIEQKFPAKKSILTKLTSLTAVSSDQKSVITRYGQSPIIYRLNNKKITSNALLNNLINSKVFNSALKEFFGTSPLSQFMDQINPLAEITHKRRLTAMGPGGVSRDSATLAIRGIHPTHYGRICPIETPEGKNTGLVNSMTTFARVNTHGIIETPFFKVYKGQVQRHSGMFYFSSEYEEKIKLAAPDLLISKVGFLPKSQNPVRIVEDFTKIGRKDIQYIGVSSVQMVSIATSLIPFLEHDDANRALMGSNMQRQAVPLIRPERPIVTTGLESRVVSDSGQAVQAKTSGVVAFTSSDKIIVFSWA